MRSDTAESLQGKDAHLMLTVCKAATYHTPNVSSAHRCTISNYGRLLLAKPLCHKKVPKLLSNYFKDIDEKIAKAWKKSYQAASCNS